MGVPLWYVLTGGPSSGKTTLLKRLEELGYHTVPEVARVLIDRCKTRRISVEKLRKDESIFQKQVLQMKLEIENKVPKDRVVFFDRGIPDSIAYYQICGLETKEIEKLSRGRYKKIFLLEQLPIKKDHARTENETVIRRLNKLLLESYKNLGYKIVFVPVLSVEERLKLVLSSL